ncbi:hypothetical protein PSGK_00025 [Pseudomonas solani]|uniref:hypothetical protein n=1 Tax=Pseudomonas solani TaxID=2731552 RepID=UPI0035BE257E
MKNDKTAPVAEQPKPTVKVVITKENGHRHAGTKHLKDAVIDVSEADAEGWREMVYVTEGELTLCRRPMPNTSSTSKPANSRKRTSKPWLNPKCLRALA